MVDRLPPEVEDLLGSQDPASRDDAWARFVAAHSRLLLHVARTVTLDPDEAMDAYAWTLERLREEGGRRFTAFGTRGNSKFTTWLVVVVRRMCLDCLRKKRGRVRADGGQSIEAKEGRKVRRRLLELTGDPFVLETIRDPGLDPAAEAQRSEQLQLLNRVLDELPPSDRLLLSLRFEDDLSASEIAGILGLPSPFHVYRRLNRLLPDLRRRLNGRGVSDSKI
jgi:RNA polymerase sigma factor (sigma-70 family)